MDELLRQWRDDTLQKLNTRMERLFDASADVMLEYADKAQSDHIRGRFYEALREIHLNHVQVREHFIAGLSRILFHFDATHEPRTPARADVLSLVEPEDFEHGLALQLIAKHAEQDHAPLFRALSIRLAAISSSKPLPLEDMPAGPHQVTNQFSASVTLLHIEHEARLALYTLFERFVMPTTLEALAHLNNQLIKYGVLPDLAPQYTLKISGEQRRAKDAGGTPDATAEQQPTPPDEQLGDEILLRIRDLLSARRAHQPVKQGQGTHLPPAPVSEVITAINTLAGSPAPPPTAAMDVGSSATVTPGELKAVRQSLLTQRTELRKKIGEDRIAADIDDVIEIVGAIFELMLNEKDLPDAVKALLSHLHTPYLKYAVIDSELLNEQHHPARRWLDDMVRSGREWVDPADLKKGLYPWMSETILTISKASIIDKKLFTQLQQSLTEQLTIRTQKQQKMEKRVGEHARGKAKLDQAQDQAQDALDDLLDNHPGAVLAADFLEDTWVNYVALLLLRSNNNINATVVKEAFALGETICDVSRQAADSPTTALIKIKRLEKLLDDAIAHLIPHVKPRIKDFIEALKTNRHAKGVHHDGEASLKRSHIRQRKAEQAPLTKEEQLIARKLKNLPPGTRFWRKPKESHNDTTMRLVWFNQQTLRFMFADLAGQHAGVLSVKELASDIAQGRARVLEEQSESFIEKALKSFQSLLKQGL